MDILKTVWLKLVHNTCYQILWVVYDRGICVAVVCTVKPQTIFYMNLVQILEQYPDARMLNKQMDKNSDTRNRLERLRMKALRKSDWETAAELQTELAWCKSEGNSLSDQMISLLKRLKSQGIKID